MRSLGLYILLFVIGCNVSVAPLPVSTCEGSDDICPDHFVCQMRDNGRYGCVESPQPQGDEDMAIKDVGLGGDAQSTPMPELGLDLGVLDAERMIEANCNDEILNNGESDVDCGGPCVPCGETEACANDTDCQSTICSNQICVLLACDDARRNGSESDEDCGGECQPCAESKLCNSRSDCLSGVCSQGACSAPSCEDIVLNGTETGVDCGGDCSPCVQCDEVTPCQDGAYCSDGQCSPRLDNGQACPNADVCQSGYCANGYCCASGDCCDRKSHCNGIFDAPATCDSEPECRGHRLESACRNNICEARQVADDSACTPDIVSNDCGPYPSVGCNGGTDQQLPMCATHCGQDSPCDGGYRCENGGCVVNLELSNGSTCTQSADCVSGHCENGFCCNSGECCVMPANCGAYPGSPASCDTVSICQGSRTEISCTNHVCASNTIDDDSACTNQVVANQCALYQEIRCSGVVNQDPPQCTFSCTVNADCDSGAWCDDGTCAVMEQQPNGNACTNSFNCASGHCQNGFCCESGNCCDTSSDCPAGLSAGATCDNPGTCQGSRIDKTCQNSMCSAQSVGDDSACGGTQVSACGHYPSISCTSARTQGTPMCAMSCTNDSECDAAAHCDQNTCVADAGNGQTCDEASDCASGYCSNGYCCSNGDCCNRATDCPATYSAAASCNEISTCQGTRTDATCVANRCASVLTNDDSACRGKARECIQYQDVFCNGATVQASVDCDTSCALETDCADEFFCLNNRCFLFDENCLDTPRLCD